VSIFHFQISSISRGAGRSAVAAAAYRSGERLRDERTGRLHNYAKRNDVLHREVLLPTGLDSSRIDWVKDRSQLWNMAEQVETRRNARLAREFQVSLPHELAADKRLELARLFSQQIADRYGVVVDLAVHEPRPEGDPRNHHAHLLMSSREITAEGFGGKAGLDMNSQALQGLGRPAGIAEMKAVREQWATLVNAAFLSAGLSERVDHRSLRAQGIDRRSGYIPYGHFKRMQRQLRPQVADRIARHHRERVAQRALEPPLAPSPGSGATEAKLSPAAAGAAAPAGVLESVRREAREAWQRLRRDQDRVRATGERRRGADRENAQETARISDHEHDL
jgi:hypothetical protein